MTNTHARRVVTSAPRKPAGAGGFPADGSTQRVDPTLERLLVAVEELTPDPRNCRLHPERNLSAICESLVRYGQRSPVVVQAGTGVVVKGNGTLLAARRLGWTHLAAVQQSFADQTELCGYGFADNRTSDLAGNDPQAEAALVEMHTRVGLAPVGMSPAEIEQRRAHAWTGAEDAEGEGAAEGVAESWSVMVVCGGEGQQLQLLERLTGEGYECRALTS